MKDIIEAETDMHSSGDHLLTALLSVGGKVEEFVQSYPGLEKSLGDDSWIEDWFIKRVEYFMLDESTNPVDLLLSDDPSIQQLTVEESVVTVPTKLIAVQPQYFRGFRLLEGPIDLSPNLVVLDGSNSSGKTSLTEALEWLFSGELVRRKMQSLGDPKELENCIANQLMPPGKECWVQAILEDQTGTHMDLKRVLISDYGATSTSRPKSQLFLDGKALSDEDADGLLMQLFAGVPPLLMQHSLRSFVLSSPSQRRDYFENLLNLDELTHLIEKAVVGKAHASSFLSPSGSVALSSYTNFISTCSEKKSATALRNALRAKPSNVVDLLTKGLIGSAILEFPSIASKGEDLNTIVSAMNTNQKEKRQEALPILAQLRPNRVVDEALKNWLSDQKLDAIFSTAASKLDSNEKAIAAAAKITESNLVIAESYNQLKEAGLIELTTEAQLCPICDFAEQPTLLSKRVVEIESWVPLQMATSTAKDELDLALKSLNSSLTELKKIRSNLIPQLIKDKEWENNIQKSPSVVKVAAKRFKKTHNKLNSDLQTLDNNITALLNIVNNSSIGHSEFTDKQKLTRNISDSFEKLIEIASGYAVSFKELDKAVGATTGEDPEYSLREQWLIIAASISAIAGDIKFDQSKLKAQKELECIREFLMDARQDYLDLRRTDFSESMDELWNQLRADRYSSFSKLHIPEPKGKGFPVNIEVKAIIDDNRQQIEVDALKIFSESQVNVLGIAAFITRSKLLGHCTIIFDDPVQSMDEDHFKTFASRLLPHLMNEGFHVIILTHNNQFAKDISHSCIDVDGYTTMHIRHSRREGCQVEEGNRRVAERLKRAERKVDEGEFVDAWKFIRLAIERLYLVTCLKYVGNQFDPSRYQAQGAEYIWNDGAGSIIASKIPTSPSRLKDILDMSAAGAHDKSASGETDLRLAIADLRSYLTALQVGG